MFRLSVVCFAVMLVGVAPAPGTDADRQSGLPFVIPLTAVIDFDCTSAATRPLAELYALTGAQDVDPGSLRRQGDRAFAIDLNGDSVKEYLVPAACDDRDNCSWVIFTIGPARLIGTVWGAVVYTSRSGVALMMAGAESPFRVDSERIDGKTLRSLAGPWPGLWTLIRTADGGDYVAYYEYGRGGYPRVPSAELTGREAREFIEKAGPPTCHPAKTP